MKTVLMAMETELLNSGRPTTPPGREILGKGTLDLEVAVGPVNPAAGKRAAGATRPPTAHVLVLVLTGMPRRTSIPLLAQQEVGL